MKWRRYTCAILLAILVVSPIGMRIAQAQSFQTGPNVSVNNTQKIDSSFYGAGSNVDISGTINGDVFCAGQNVSITGTVQGDVICAGQTVTIDGTINGNVRVAGQTVTINGKVMHRLSVATQSFSAGSSSNIGSDVSIVGSSITLNGSIGRDAVLAGQSIIINGQVGRNVKSKVRDLTISNNAQINGDVNYTSAHTASVAGNARISGKVTQTVPPVTKHSWFSYKIGFLLYWIISLLIVSLVLVLLFPALLQNVTNNAMHHVAKMTLVGFLTSIGLPIIGILLLLTFIGIPLGILIWLVMLVIGIFSMPVSAYYLGRRILPKNHHALQIMIFGSLLLLLLIALPFIGWLFGLIAFWLGTGMIMQAILKKIGKPSYHVT